MPIIGMNYVSVHVYFQVLDLGHLQPLQALVVSVCVQFMSINSLLYYQFSVYLHTKIPYKKQCFLMTGKIGISKLIVCI